MRLTNYMRDAFVSAAMQDVPAVDYAEKARVTALETIDGLFARTFPGVDRTSSGVDEWLTQRGVRMPDGLDRIYTEAPGYDCLETQTEVWAALTALAEANGIQEKTRSTLHSKLYAVARSCNTRKQLVDALPEMEKYLPEDEPAAMRTLPVVTNVVADFVNAGWPKA